MAADFCGDLDSKGYAVVPDVFGPDEISSLIDALEDSGIARSTRGDAVFGGRNLLGVEAISKIAGCDRICALVAPLLGAGAVAVRGVFFDKTRGANWPVAWHQDLSIELASRADLNGWEQWRVKDGIHLVQPPTSVLEQMLAIRIHLDDCSADNGALRVIPGSHREGRLSRERMSALREECGQTMCAASRGSILMMRPLLLHASSPSANPSHRRVVHLDYASFGALPDELRWAIH